MKFLSIKGWDRFQHYKDRDPPWVKLYRDLLTSESWVLGTDTSRLLQVASVLLAARYNNRIPYRWDFIRKVASLECTERQFEDAVRHLAVNDFIEIESDQSVTNAAELVEHSASTVIATCPSEAEAIQSREETETEAETEAEKNLMSAPPPTRIPKSDPDWFQDFKRIYPARSGDQGWAKALRGANQRIREGHSPDEFLEGARRYAAYSAAVGNLGTQYVKQASSFLGTEKFFVQPWTPPSSKADLRLSSNLSAADEFMRRTEISQ